jgi:hypothetical protein
MPATIHGSRPVSSDLAELVELGDPTALLRAVDGLCTTRDWAGLVELRARLEEAVERGRPLWPLVTWVEYRLALEAPAPEAAAVLRPGAGRFALGPLTEVAASVHTWAELAPHLTAPAVAGTVAQERVLRGEDLRGDQRAAPEVLEVPLALATWEPDYPLPVYRPDRMQAPDPPAVPEPTEVPGPRSPGSLVEVPTELDRPDVVRALLDLVEVWTSESEGRAEAVVVAGDAAAAVSALLARDPGAGNGRVPRLARIDPATAMAWMAWAAASGGAHGVRRGGALGRFDAWWAAAALTGAEWPPDPPELGRALGRLTWWAWDDGGPAHGWVLRLAAADPAGGWAAALDARDVSADPGRRRAGSADDDPA